MMQVHYASAFFSDPDRPILIQHKRGQGDTIETRFVRDSVLRLDPPGLEVGLGEVLARP